MVTTATADTTQTTLTLPAGTYYWSVVSDVTRDGVVPQGQLFGVVGATLYISCDSASDCASAPDELGTIARPYHSIDRGLTAAKTLSIADVRVASRGNDAPYTDPIRVLAGINVTGGYDPAFAAQTGKAAITVSGTGIIAIDIASPTTINGFAITNTNGIGQASTAVRISECSQDFVLTNIDVTAPTLTSSIVRIEDSSDEVGPTIGEATLQGLYGTDRNDVPNLTLVEVEGAVQLVNVSMSASVPTGYPTLTGLHLADVPFTFKGGGITVQGALATTGIDLSANAVTASLQGISVIASADGSDGSTCTRPAGGHRRHARHRELSTLSASHADAATAVSLLATTSFVRIASSVIAVDDGTILMGISSAVDLRLSGSTIVTGSASNTAVGLELDSQHEGGAAGAALANNIFLSLDSTCSDTPCSIGIAEASSRLDLNPTGETLGEYNNAFIGFANTTQTCPHQGKFGCAQPGDAIAGVSVVNNVGYDTSSDALLGTDFRPQAGSPLLGAGMDTTQNICANRDITAPSCGDSVIDRDGNQRPTPPAIGAYEASGG